MPANMMNAAVGSSEYVTGRSSATVSAGPIPGNTPTAVPSVTPASAQSRLRGASATANPSTSALRASIHMVLLEPARGESDGQGDPESVHEQHVHGCAERESHQRVVQPAATSERGRGAREERRPGHDEPRRHEERDERDEPE